MYFLVHLCRLRAGIALLLRGLLLYGYYSGGKGGGFLNGPAKFLLILWCARVDYPLQKWFVGTTRVGGREMIANRPDIYPHNVS